MSLFNSQPEGPQSTMLGAPSFRHPFGERVGYLDFQPAGRRQLAPPKVVCEWVGNCNPQWDLFIGNPQ
jgi:hypothetical protein